MGRHVGEPLKATVVYLLHPANLLQFHDLDGLRVLKIGHRRVVEGDMPVFPDAHAHDIDGALVQEGGICGARDVRIRVLAVEIMNGQKRPACKDALAQEVAEALRRMRRQADVFVHVKRFDAGKINAPVGDGRRKEFVLRRRRRKDDADAFLLGKQLPDGVRKIGSRNAAQLFPCGQDLYRKFVLLKCLHAIFSFRLLSYGPFSEAYVS